jgi:ABC-type lipoprotein release transport system permease subunit
MKALGLLRRQVRWITAWHTTTVAMLALLIGLPLGIALGRWAWALFATGLGIADDTVTPVTIMLLMVPATVLAANTIAFWPARKAARLSPAEILHAE